MVGTEVILSAVRREIHRAMQKPHKPSRVGLVSSYDPKQRAVKVQLQPEGTQTGWIPSRLAISRRRPDKPAEVQAGEYHLFETFRINAAHVSGICGRFGLWI